MRLLFLGPPGAGKGTQCQLLSTKLRIPHLSSGDLLRAAVAQNTEAGKKAATYMNDGHLVPDDVLIEMFKEALKQDECKNGYILDGFPRNLAQAKSLDVMLKCLNQSLVKVININIDVKPLTERITGRRVCSNKNCLQVYHIKFHQSLVMGICDKCKSALNTRSDDKEELVKVRLQTYFKQTEPLIEYYSSQGLLVNIAGDKQTSDVFDSILSSLKQQMPAK